jgi:hypothetical protein
MRKNNKIKILLICFVIFAVFTATGCGGGGTGESVPAGTNSISLEWDPPIDNVDGSPLTDLAGYKIYNVSSGNYTLSATVANRTTSTTIDNLSSGNWCFVATAYNTAGSESDYSDPFCTNI